jgi:hypothetical protein
MPGRDHFRAMARRRVGLSATLLSHDAGWEQPVRVVDLGLGGARLEVADGLGLGSSVRLLIATPNRWDPVALDAHVVWSREPDGVRAGEAGLRFDHHTSSDVRALVDLLGADAYE